MSRERIYNRLSPEDYGWLNIIIPDNLRGKLESFSQAYQDLFVLYLFNGKHNGIYLEIGCNKPIYTNNTYMLYEYFDWNGLSLDYLDLACEWFDIRPRSYFLKTDVLKESVNDKLVLYMPEASTLDYLQLDIDPAPNTLKALRALDHNSFRFRCITYEHDAYSGLSGEQARAESREVLNSLGYELAIPDVLVDDGLPYEDWWIDPLTCSESELRRARLLRSFSDSRKGSSPKELLMLAISQQDLA